MKDIRVNLRAAVDSKAIRVENWQGQDYLVIPSYTLPDNVVMNGGLYPKAEIDKAWVSLEGTLAPVGHPFVTNDAGEAEYISAHHPVAITKFHAGAHNRNVKRDGHRVYSEKWLNIDYASRTEPGKRLLAAVNYDAEAGTVNGPSSPIHTSTGLILQQDDAPAGMPYKWIARNMRLDHDAILLDEPGAATPEQGVGLMVNTADAVPLPEAIEADKGLLEKLGAIVANLLGGVSQSKTPITTNQPGEAEMTPEELKEAIGAALAEPLAAVNAKIDAITNTVTTLQTNAQASVESADREVVKAKHGELIANSLKGDALAQAAAAIRAETGGAAEPLPAGTAPNATNAQDGEQWGLVVNLEGK